MKKLNMAMAVAGIAAVFALDGSPVQAGSHWSVGVNTGPMYYGPRYYPGYYAPVRYYAPPPVYYGPPPCYYGGYGYGYAPSFSFRYSHH